MPRYSKSMSGDKIEEVLRNALPLLCSNAVSYGSQISIDALIGITVDSSEVILVNIHEQLDKSGSQFSSDNLAGDYGNQHAVKSELLDDAGCTSFRQQQEDITATAADSCKYMGSTYTTTGTPGFGSSGQLSSDVVNISDYGDDDDGLGYDENCDLKEDQYMNSFQTDHSDEFGGEYFNAGMTYGGGDDDAGAGVYSADVKPFSMTASQVGEYSFQVHRSVSVSNPRGHKRRGASQASVRRQSHSNSGTQRPPPKAAVKKEFGDYSKTGGEFADYCETGAQWSDIPHSKGILANEKTTVYTCSVCGKMFRHAGTLQRHKQQHEGVVFRCDLCGAVLSRRDVLTAHRRKCEEKLMQPSDTM